MTKRATKAFDFVGYLKKAVKSYGKENNNEPEIIKSNK